MLVGIRLWLRTGALTLAASVMGSLSISAACFCSRNKNRLEALCSSGQGSSSCCRQQYRQGERRERQVRVEHVCCSGMILVEDQELLEKECAKRLRFAGDGCSDVFMARESYSRMFSESRLQQEGALRYGATWIADAKRYEPSRPRSTTSRLCALHSISFNATFT